MATVTPIGAQSAGDPVPRPRLGGRLDELAARRLTMVVGGPGTGKTTLLRQWAGRDTVWHTINPSDRVVANLARHLTESIRLRVPDLSSELALAVEGARGPESGAADLDRVETLAAELCRDLQGRLKSHLVLVLDDLHLLGETGESVGFVSSLCRNAPELLHVVIASRAPVPFPTSRLSVQGEAGAIVADELAFSIDELVDLAEKMKAPPEVAAGILERTGGWSVAVALAMRLASRTGVEPEIGEGTELFEYLAEEVIGAEEEKVVEALSHVAELQWFTPELVADLGLGEPGQALFEPARRVMYTTPASAEPGAVSLSPLIAEFLVSRHRLPEPERVQMLTTAAAWYENNAAVAEAMDCLVKAGRHQEVAETLRRHGETLLIRGGARQLAETFEAITDVEDDSEVTLLAAEALQMLGDWERATELYGSLTPTHGPIPARIAWRLGFLEHMRGNVPGALDVYRRGELDGADPADGAALLAWTASAHWLRGERDEARELANRALALARASNDSRSLATAHTVLAMVAALDGDRSANDIHYLRALEHAELARDVIQTLRIRVNRGSHFLEEGDFDTALAETEIALRLADLTGFELWRGISLSNRAQILAGRGRLEEAMLDLVQSRRIFRRMGSALESYPLTQLGDVYALRGETALARGAFEDAIRLAEDPADLQALVPALAGLARLLVGDDPKRAKELAERAASHPTVIGHVRALMARGEVALTRGDVESARQDAATAAEVARQRHDLPGLAEALELGAAAEDSPDSKMEHLRQALAVWREVGSDIGGARVEAQLAELEGGPEAVQKVREAAATLRRLGARGLAQHASRVAERLSRAEASEVRIRTFGGLVVYRLGEPAPVAEWQSRVAREVFGMLIASRGASLHREVIIGRLWPDEPLDKGSNRLSVALSTIRSVLDPEKRHDSGHYIVADRETVALDLDHLEVDIETFLEDTRRGRQLMRDGRREEGLAVLRSAEARYVGEFLGDHPYAEWATPIREEARWEFMSIATTLAEAAMDEGDYDGATRWYLRILEQDPYNEPAHVALIGAMIASGRHGTARRLYSLYVSRMSELEAEPVPFPDLREG